MTKPCFFNNCGKKVNARGKFCAEHDRLETESAERMAAIFSKFDDDDAKAKGEKNAD